MTDWHNEAAKAIEQASELGADVPSGPEDPKPMSEAEWMAILESQGQAEPTADKGGRACQLEVGQNYSGLCCDCNGLWCAKRAYDGTR